MSDTMLRKLEDQYRSRLSLISTITDEAAKRDGGLSDQDRATIQSAQEEARSLQADIELLSQRIELNESTRERLRIQNPGSDLAPANVRSRGELVWLKMRAAHDADARHRYETFMRAAQHMGTTAANTTPTAGGMPGLLVAQNVGPIIDVSPVGRPLASAIGVTPSGDPMSFRRPRIEDPNWAAGVGEQAGGLEKGELPSRAFDVTAEDVSLTTLGGYLNISAQLMAMPIGALDLAITRLERRYARLTEGRVLTSITAGADTTVTLAANAGGAEFLAALYAASARVYAATGELASWVAMGPTGYARVGSFVDLADRPLFPSTQGVNAMGSASAADFAPSSIAGLRPIVTPGITGGDFFVGNALGVEAYEYRFPLFEAVEPSVLGRQIAVSGAFGTYRPVDGGVARIAPAAA